MIWRAHMIAREGSYKPKGTLFSVLLSERLLCPSSDGRPRERHAGIRMLGMIIPVSGTPCLPHARQERDRLHGGGVFGITGLIPAPGCCHRRCLRPVAPAMSQSSINRR